VSLCDEALEERIGNKYSNMHAVIARICPILFGRIPRSDPSVGSMDAPCSARQTQGQFHACDQPSPTARLCLLCV